MIELIGEPGTSEYAAAERIKEALAALWPGAKTSPSSREWVRIAANAKLSGYGVSDFDVIVIGLLGGGDRRFLPSRAIRAGDEKTVSGTPVLVRNFVAVIEVKDHDAKAVRVVGDRVDVQYSRRGTSEWKSATDQNVAQVHALVSYVRDLTGEKLFVFRCLMMQGLPSIMAAAAVPYEFNGARLLTELVSVSGVRRGTGGLVLSSGADDTVRRALSAPVFVTVMPTALDRRRMDAVVTGSAVAEKVYAELGKRMAHLRGQGGTGKTVMLLHAAWRAFKLRGDRTLVLTYNRALAADIRRLMCLMRIPSSSEEGGVTVQTVMAFMSSWFVRLGIADVARDDDDDGYDSDCRIARDHLKGGAVTKADIDKVIADHQEQYGFDGIVVDEAQDWPQAEADLLKLLYGPRKICLADGVDQLVRTQRRTDWRRDVAEADAVVIPLQECLRMKRNLALFANTVARCADVPWKIMPSEHAGGGRVIVVCKPLGSGDGLFEELAHAAKAAGNDEVDMLHCVPSSDIDERDGRRSSAVGAMLRANGKETWDGTDERVRKDFPRRKSQLRIVHYASCRGLEGWSVVLHRFDEFWQECHDIRINQPPTDEEDFGFEDVVEVAAQCAWQRCLIAMTRPIDTLVITLSDPRSTLSAAILNAAHECKDFVEIRGS